MKCPSSATILRLKRRSKPGLHGTVREQTSHLLRVLHPQVQPPRVEFSSIIQGIDLPSIGKLLTTPSRLLKLVLPLTTLDRNSDQEDIAPLALLVHPQQPLSYLERLIQAELPSITTDKGKNRIPSISFKAVEAEDDKIKRKKVTEEDLADPTTSSRGGPGEGGVESYSGAGHEAKGKDSGKFVRWSSSTEIGDFVRDAARAKEFIVEIEGAPREIMVGVPSFNDRTFYLRQRLRKTSRKLADMTVIKKECDVAAHKAGQRLAMAGFGVMLGYWYVVYRLTFETDLGWDTMEPVTYLIGLSALMGGYLWFLYHNREVSYKAALNLTISRRQNKLYEARGFNLERWESLVEEGNALRKEIKAVAAEYDVEWDEKADEYNEDVSRALKNERKDDDKKKKSEGKADEDDE
jgi:calcium uniporter protein, mitochondrial